MIERLFDWISAQHNDRGHVLQRKGYIVVRGAPKSGNLASCSSSRNHLPFIWLMLYFSREVWAKSNHRNPFFNTRCARLLHLGIRGFWVKVAAALPDE